ncbi:MAG: ATPase [Ruminococcaceae bacterium]|nr:ATPase [Oscillospiraceae bacterium]
MNIEEILDTLDELLDKSWGLPLSGGRCVVDAERVRELLDDIRLNMPTEIRQAKAIVADRAEIIAIAKREAETVIHRAEERAKVLVSEQEIVKQSQEKAADIIATAQSKSKEMRYAASEFADNILKTTEQTLADSLNDVKTTRQALHQKR